MKKQKMDFLKFDPKAQTLICQGEWDLIHVSTLKSALEKIKIPSADIKIISGNAITNMDSAGAWLLSQWIKKQGQHIQLQDFSAPHEKLLSLIEKENLQQIKVPKITHPNVVARIGKQTSQFLTEARDYLAFVGKLGSESVRVLMHPSHIRWPAIANVIETTGYQALPIIALLSFMVGVVIAYQMGLQLQQYGANVFIVDLLGLSILREFGPLITSIMVAGRTGAAYTAQLGTMKVNQEIDALDTMGVTPAEILLLPRIIGLVIVLPLLTIWADVFGVLGGMVMAKNMMGMGWHDFLLRFQHQISLSALVIGLGKAPVFALIIASIGCFAGMQVKGSADSVGKQTTRSVVLAIFFIIVADGIFSVIFSKLDL